MKEKMKNRISPLIVAIIPAIILASCSGPATVNEVEPTDRAISIPSVTEVQPIDTAKPMPTATSGICPP